MDQLDKYYTKDECVKHIVEITLKFFPDTTSFLEPSAGSGNISHYLKSLNLNVIAYDIAPESPDIIQSNYLTQRIPVDNHITIGNPPFGYKGDLAIAFLNKALLESRAVAFIMAITANKYSVQKKILKGARLIYQETLPNNSFELPDKTEYSCPSLFQIWTRESTLPNLRLHKPSIKHNDFELYRHNATETSKKYLDYEWDFAVYAQGWKDYTQKFFPKDYEILKDKITNTSDQFYFFKAKDKNVLEKLLSINFDKLAHENHITPGFCKNDIIQEYEKLTGGGLCQM